MLDYKLHVVELEGRGESNGQPCLIEIVCTTKLGTEEQAIHNLLCVIQCLCVCVSECVCMYILSVLSVSVPVRISL